MRIACVAGLVLALAAVSNAQTSDEQQIRAQIAKFDSGQRLEVAAKDRIFWSGAYKRPFIRPDQGEEVPDQYNSERVPGSQRNKTTPVRIEIAKSGDLAYEFSNHVLMFELKDGRKISLPASVLRVWRKETGEWKVAAQFSHSHYQEPAATRK
jgi:hypothetical protein